jgi:hypothetical protein
VPLSTVTADVLRRSPYALVRSSWEVAGWEWARGWTDADFAELAVVVRSSGVKDLFVRLDDSAARAWARIDRLSPAWPE